MSRFDTVIVVDWSAGMAKSKAPQPDSIWIGVTREGASLEPVYQPSRVDAEETIRELITREVSDGRRVLAAFDFPFGYPKGFASIVAGSSDPLAVWAWLEARMADDMEGRNNRYEVAESINALFEAPGPFWGKPWQWSGRYPGIPFGKKKDGVVFAPFSEFRECERIVRARSRRTTSSCFQLNASPTVGGQVLTGLPMLNRLRRHLDAAVWPFEDAEEASVVFAEIWPSLVEDGVKLAEAKGEIRDSAQVRLLSLALARVAPERLEEMMRVPEIAHEEAWILGAEYHKEITELVQDGLSDGLKPPRLKNDCFALPPGVDWTPVDEALDRLRARLTRVVGQENLPVNEAAGRVLAADAVAVRPNPPAANSAVDGYGLAHAATGDGDQILPLIDGRAAAGAPFEGAVPEGSAVRILTGALLPEGVDTVVLEEDVSTDGARIAFEGPLRKGANTRKAGEDVAAGEIAVAAGTRLGPAELAILSATGVTGVFVNVPLRVGVLSTGDELAEPGDTRDSARTYDANRPMLLSLVQDWRMEAVDLGHVGDDRAALRATLEDATARCDVILTSGGASAGDEDHVSGLLGETGSRADWRIALKPGRPLALGVWNGVPVFGLPGNPVAALVCTLIFARPAFGVLGGEGWKTPQGFMVPAGFEKTKKPGRREYLRARMRADGTVEVFASEGSGRISGLAWADGLVELPDGPVTVRAGDAVRYLPYSSFR